MFWVWKGSELGGECFGPYRTAEEAAQCITRLTLDAFKLQDGIDRTYKILRAKTESGAEKKAAKYA